MSNILTLPTSWASSATPEAVEIAGEVARMLHVDALPFYADQVDWYLRAGFSAELLLMAAESTMMAPRPSWAYFRAILRHCAEEGCYTPEQYMIRIEDFKHARQVFGGYQKLLEAAQAAY